MIRLKQQKSGDDGNPRKVSIRELTDQFEIAKTLAMAFRPSLAGQDVQPSLNSLGDHVLEWYEDNWGKKAAIQINGFSDLLKRDPTLAVDLVLLFAGTETAIAAYRGSQQTPFHHDLNRLQIILS